MSDFADRPDDAVDRWLTDQRQVMVDDLATTLDLDAGLREVTIPTRHTDLVADLRDVLDVESGLSSILPVTPANASDTDCEETPPAPQLPTELHDLVDAIASANPTSRFAMRTQRTPVLVDAFARAHEDALELDLDLASALARAPDFARARVLALARARALDLACALDLDLDLDLARALARARALNHALDRAGGLDCNLASDLDEIHRALNDFTGADLRNADLAGGSLDGLRWSSTTQWPPNWIERIERESVEVEPGIFEVRGGTAHAPTTV